MNKQLLTRRGARNLTAAIDRIATVIQNNPDVLGIDPRIAMDYAHRCDLVSDAIESTAVTNFPLRNADDNMSLSSDGFPADDIGEEEPGPLEQLDSDEPFMNDHFTQDDLHELGQKEEAGELPSADKFAAMLAEFESSLEVKEAASKMPDVLIQGYDGFTDQVRGISELQDRVEELKAELAAAAGDLPKLLADAEKEYKKAAQVVVTTYKEKLTEVGNITIQRKTKLVEAQASLKVVATKRSLNDVQAEMLAAVTEKYGEEVAAFIAQTQSALQDMDKKMRITVQGFELEQRARTASYNGVKVAGLADMLGKFRTVLEKGWSKMVSVAQAAVKIISGASKRVEKAENDFFKAIKDVPKLASGSRSNDFDLFA